MSAADIHRQITEVYGIEAMSDSKVRKWVRKFKDGRKKILDEERSGRPSVITHNLMQAVETKILPRLLAGEHREKRFAISLDFSIRYEEEGVDTLSQIVTGDETWVSHITPDSKQQSMEWRHTSSPVNVKAKQTLSKHIMATEFWGWHGVLLVHFMTQGNTINSGA
ncbi:mariner Mos1 transposase [Trichonephila clavipes]|nr:mariner Mos1 transposase [Trichonephila clavipes]